MPRSSSTGICRTCHREVAKSGMTRHLKTCLRQQGPGKHLLIRAEGRYAKDYWVYVLVPKATELWEIDAMLRNLWLECCGHLSAFTTPSVSYLEDPEPSPWGPPEKSMNVSLKRAMKDVNDMHYEYDFGSTTALNLRLLGDELYVGPDDSMLIVARNNPPEILCDKCGQNATQLVFEDWEARAFCDTCAKKFDDDEEAYMLPVINSPRMGVCGYTGPSIEP